MRPHLLPQFKLTSYVLLSEPLCIPLQNGELLLKVLLVLLQRLN